MKVEHGPGAPFLFNPAPPTDICTLSLHDALPILKASSTAWPPSSRLRSRCSKNLSLVSWTSDRFFEHRSEEHTSELQSRPHLVCRLLLEKKKRCSCAVMRRSVR